MYTLDKLLHLFMPLFPTGMGWYLIIIRELKGRLFVKGRKLCIFKRVNYYGSWKHLANSFTSRGVPRSPSTLGGTFLCESTSHQAPFSRHARENTRDKHGKVVKFATCRLKGQGQQSCLWVEASLYLMSLFCNLGITSTPSWSEQSTATTKTFAAGCSAQALSRGTRAPG